MGVILVCVYTSSFAFGEILGLIFVGWCLWRGLVGLVGMAGWSRLVGVLVGSVWVGSACRVVLAGEVATPWQRSGEGLEGEFD